MQRDNNLSIPPQSNNQPQSAANNPQFLTKHQRDDQSIQTVLTMPQKKAKVEEIEMKKYANIVQSTFSNTNNTITAKPLQYTSPKMPQLQGNPVSNIGNQFKYSSNYPNTRLNNLYNGRYTNHYSNYASTYNQYEAIGKTPYQYLKHNANPNFNMTNNMKYGINMPNLINQINQNSTQDLGSIQQQLSQPQTQQRNSTFPMRSNLQEKAKYVIKDIPEMTVGNFLQNKGIQDMYLNNIKKTEEETNKEQSNNNTKLNPKISLGKEEKNTITNVNIHNYNYNYNITTATGNNNIIIQTKEGEPQMKSSQTIPAQSINLSNTQKNKTDLESGTKEKKGDFPPMLQNYITRAFQRCKNNEDIEKCQKGLLKIMENTISKGDMYSRNWNDYPLPEILDTILKQEQSKLNSYPNKSKKKATNHSILTPAPLHNQNTGGGNALYQFLGSDILEKIESYKPIIGKCTDLEKDYYRMTEHPDISQIRPEYILKKSLKMLIDKWKNKTADYHYISMQFRSIRQDLTVQIIQNEFSVRVYETHSKIALESYDLPQFNQCQTALIPLYAMGIKGSQNEFFAYRILYTSLYEKIEMSKIMSLIKKKYNKNNYTSEISHSIQILKALNEPNYFQFLSLYSKAPNMGKYLIEPFLPRLRIKALQVIAYGYYSEIDIHFVLNKLSFKSIEECLEFLKANNLLIKDNKLLCKENILALNSNQLLSTLIGKT